MTDTRLDGLRVAILVADDFEQVEMTDPRTALDAAGARTVLVSPVEGQVHGMQHDNSRTPFPSSCRSTRPTPTTLTPCCCLAGP